MSISFINSYRHALPSSCCFRLTECILYWENESDILLVACCTTLCSPIALLNWCIGKVFIWQQHNLLLPGGASNFLTAHRYIQGKVGLKG